MTNDLREQLGIIVRNAWVERCKLKSVYRPDHVAPWEEMSEFDKETDRVIGEEVAEFLGHRNTPSVPTSIHLLDSLGKRLCGNESPTFDVSTGQLVIHVSTTQLRLVNCPTCCGETP